MMKNLSESFEDCVIQSSATVFTINCGDKATADTQDKSPEFVDSSLRATCSFALHSILWVLGY